jgi:hypothetical protein
MAGLAKLVLRRILFYPEIMPDAVKLKYIPAPLTPSQLKELIQVPLQ